MKVPAVDFCGSAAPASNGASIEGLFVTLKSTPEDVIVMLPDAGLRYSYWNIPAQQRDEFIDYKTSMTRY